MSLIDRYLAELDREAARTRAVLQHVPSGHDDFKPHEKSMPFGRLAGLVATMPSWISLILQQDELDITPRPGQAAPAAPTAAGLVAAHDEHVSKAREALRAASDEFITTTKWRLKAHGAVVWNELRDDVLRDTFNHLAHHRGQLTVYLRLLNQRVPAVYGPSADDRNFA